MKTCSRFLRAFEAAWCRKTSLRPPFYGPMDKEASQGYASTVDMIVLNCLQGRTPAPLFSICASDDFWDILFPNVPTLACIDEIFFSLLLA